MVNEETMAVLRAHMLILQLLDSNDPMDRHARQYLMEILRIAATTGFIDAKYLRVLTDRYTVEEFDG